MDLKEMEMNLLIINNKIRKYIDLDFDVYRNEIVRYEHNMLQSESESYELIIKEEKRRLENVKLLEKKQERERINIENSRMRMELKKLSRKEYI